MMEGGMNRRSHENQIKVLFFMKTLESSDQKMLKKLKLRLETETENFFLQNQIIEKDKYRQLIRNFSELIE
jgi:hypothetical protein